MTDFIIKYWLEAAFAGITALAGLGFGYIRKRMKAESEKQKKQTDELVIIKLGLQALLRSALMDSYSKYTELEYIPVYAMENVRELYEQYHALGGNGTVTTLLDKLDALPQKKDEQ